MPRMDAGAGGRHDLTDAQWELLAPLLPEPASRGRPRRYGLRALINGVCWRVRVGAPWRDVPIRYGPWWRVYALFRPWQAAGVWERIEAELVAMADASGRLDWRVSVDSTVCRAHVHAAGARRDSPRTVDGEPDDHALGVCRGGWSTKIHAAVGAGRGPLSMLLTAGQRADCPMMIPVLEAIRVARPAPGRPRRRPRRVLADKAYSSQANRAWLRAHHIRATVPVKTDQAAHRRARGSRGGRPPAFDAVAYEDRNAVERGFSHLKHHRALATRYDKLAVRYRATTHIASISWATWARHGVRRAKSSRTTRSAPRGPVPGRPGQTPLRGLRPVWAVGRRHSPTAWEVSPPTCAP